VGNTFRFWDGGGSADRRFPSWARNVATMEGEGGEKKKTLSKTGNALEGECTLKGGKISNPGRAWVAG